MKESIAASLVIAVLVGWSVSGWSATNNTGNNPAFLVMSVISNAYANLSQETIDIGVDIGADGNYDYWLSEDTSFVPDGGNTVIRPANWKTILIVLDQFANETAKIKIIDNSASHFIAVNSIRLNFADGQVVPNGVPNGYFEEDPPLSGWTILSGGLTADQLVSEDAEINSTYYSTRFLNTNVNGLTDVAVIESDAFELTPISSFIYGTFAGPASSRFDKPGSHDSDNGIFVYVDLGTETQDPDGQYTEGEDVPLYGYYWQAADNGMEAAIINTSGLEGRRAQFVAADVSLDYGISLDCIRMNWDNAIIRNGGFEEGFEGGTLPPNFEGSSPRIPEDHPSGSIPGWSVNPIPNLEGNPIDDELAIFAFFGRPADGYARSGRVWMGSGTNLIGEEDPVAAGVELRSDVFVITPIPDPSQNVFMSFNSGQQSSRIDDVFDPATGSGEDRFSTIELQVDIDENGSFEDDGDFVYQQVNQGISWFREQFSEVDEWHYPEYRFYIADEHQGKSGRIYIAETMTGGWAWMAADDFYFWDGGAANLAFPNSDFENGDLTNWNEEAIDQMISWLSTTPDNYAQGLATHIIMNGIVTWLDGEFAVDSAQREGGSGDNATGILWSDPFTIPTLNASSNLSDWHLY
ncbi:MAG: hypothetical protein JXR73_00125 [Candidatus Omnitrophica bacterium]|nr:hypothetical protein [Candidatus Omnitrophota bacterium]